MHRTLHLFYSNACNLASLIRKIFEFCILNRIKNEPIISNHSKLIRLRQTMAVDGGGFDFL